MNCDPEMRHALTDAESGLMRPGALPHIDTATAAGNKSLLDSIEKAKPKGCREPDPIKNQEGQQVTSLMILGSGAKLISSTKGMVMISNRQLGWHGHCSFAVSKALAIYQAMGVTNVVCS